MHFLALFGPRLFIISHLIKKKCECKTHFVIMGDLIGRNQLKKFLAFHNLKAPILESSGTAADESVYCVECMEKIE